MNNLDNLIEEYSWDIKETTNNYKIHNYSSGHEDVKIAILDSGIDLNHKGFNNIVKFKNFIDDNEKDQLGHGTMIAGQIAGNGLSKGICPNASLYIYKIINGSDRSLLDYLINALEECIIDRVSIINLSIGFNIDEKLLESKEIIKLENLFKKIDDLGIFCISSSGYLSEGVHIPSYFENVITCQGLSRNYELVNKNLKADFALLTGDYTNPTKNFTEYIAVYAPSSYSKKLNKMNIPEGYSFYSGESFAAAKLTGLIGLIKSYDIERKNNKRDITTIINLIESFSHEIGRIKNPDFIAIFKYLEKYS